MSDTTSETLFAPLTDELVKWAESNQTIRLFLRDDDAVKITDELIRLAALCQNYKIPALVAIIPDKAQVELTGLFKRYPLLTPAVHGIAHINYADKDEKKIELGDHRPLQQTLDELSQMREKLSGLFGLQLSPALVPPWNRISDKVAAHAGTLGFEYISGFSWKERECDLPWLNTHIDVIDWKNAKSPKPLIRVVEELAENLAIARERGFKPVGILTHHLDHNEQCWEMLDRLFAFLAEQDNVSFKPADELVINP